MFCAAVSLAIWLRRRKVPGILALLIAFVLFVAVDIGLYMYGLRKRHEALLRHEKPGPFEPNYFENDSGH
jgi:hypothetical protein